MEEFDSISIEVNHMKKLDMMQDPRYADSVPEKVPTHQRLKKEKT